MTTRIGTLFTVLLACLALSLSACGKDDKKDGDKKGDKKDDKKKDDKKKDDKKKDDKKADKGGDGDMKEMHTMADKMIKIADALCECKDKECAEGKNKEMDALMEEGEKKFGGKDEKGPPQEIQDKLMPAMTKAGECMEKLMGGE